MREEGKEREGPQQLKCPTQHHCDLLMFSSKAELQPVFKSILTNQNKKIDCIRVDGATDEGLGHEQVQYWWTEWHVLQRRVVTLVTYWNSGSSYLNRVKLPNGCSLITFIPSTLARLCIVDDTGAISERNVRQNLSLAMSAYVSRVDGCPCGDTTIKLYEGVVMEEYLDTSKKLDIF